MGRRRRLLESGLKVLVDGRDVGHDALPVRPLRVHHFVDVLERRAPSTSAFRRRSPVFLKVWSVDHQWS